jgi:hypothetical protein
MPRPWLQHVQRVPRQAFGHVDEGLQRLEGAHEVPDLLARAQHHAEHGQLGQRHAQLLDARAQFVAVERPRHHRAPARLAARRLGVVVGEDRRHVELHAGVAGEEVDRLRALLQEGVDTRGVEMRGRLVLQVGAAGAGGLGDALLGGQAGVRDPQPAARARGGAAEARLPSRPPAPSGP